MTWQYSYFLENCDWTTEILIESWTEHILPTFDLVTWSAGKASGTVCSVVRTLADMTGARGVGAKCGSGWAQWAAEQVWGSWGRPLPSRGHPTPLYRTQAVHCLTVPLDTPPIIWWNSNHVSNMFKTKYAVNIIVFTTITTTDEISMVYANNF